MENFQATRPFSNFEMFRSGECSSMKQCSGEESAVALSPLGPCQSIFNVNLMDDFPSIQMRRDLHIGKKISLTDIAQSP